jgi:predicted SAM-dependent methyltransferase
MNNKYDMNNRMTKAHLFMFIKGIPFIGTIAARFWRMIRGYKRITEKRNFINTLSSNPQKIRLVIGSSRRYEVGWIPTDIEYLNILYKNDWKRYFKINSVDAILSEHVWEHLTLEEGKKAVTNCYAYLRKGGYIRIAVPDGFNPDEEYIKYQDVGGHFSDEYGHKVLYNYRSLSSLFEESGFQITLLEYFDEDGRLHVNNWDQKEGKIYRSSKFDSRFDKNNPIWTSLILDAKKV